MIALHKITSKNCSTRTAKIHANKRYIGSCNTASKTLTEHLQQLKLRKHGLSLEPHGFPVMAIGQPEISHGLCEKSHGCCETVVDALDILFCRNRDFLFVKYSLLLAT